LLMKIINELFIVVIVTDIEFDQWHAHSSSCRNLMPHNLFLWDRFSHALASNTPGRVVHSCPSIYSLAHLPPIHQHFRLRPHG
jgi:hypothetical protein